jgi:hypothetical protein
VGLGIQKRLILRGGELEVAIDVTRLTKTQVQDLPVGVVGDPRRAFPIREVTSSSG